MVEELRTEIETLRRLVLERDHALKARDQRIAEQERAVASLQERARILEHNIEVYRRMLFAPSSEKRRPVKEPTGDMRQGHLFLVALVEEAERVADATGAHGSVEIRSHTRRPAKSGRRAKLPEHLLRIRTTYEIAQDERRCACGTAMPEIGEELTHELERLETTLVHEIARKKYACKRCEEGVLTAPGPARVIKKGLLGPGFLAHVAVERFCQHMPYNRLEKKYASEGLDLSRVVLSGSMRRIAELAEPIWDVLGESVVNAEVGFTDDTPSVVLSSSEGGRRLGRFWVHLDLEGNHYFTFSESRSRNEPERVLKDFRGFLHADAFAGYDRLYGPEGAREVACWSHARRYFVQAQSSDPELAKQALDRIGALYGVERQAKGLAPPDRHRLRLERSKPLLEELFAWLATVEAQVLPKSPMGKAVHYVMAQRGALLTYLEDGRLEIDNNRSERALRPIALGRKNWLHVGNERGGKTASVLMSLLHTARAVGVDPREYLRDVLLRLAATPESKRRELARELVPSRWKELYQPEVHAHQASILERLAANLKG